MVNYYFHQQNAQIKSNSQNQNIATRPKSVHFYKKKLFRVSKKMEGAISPFFSPQLVGLKTSPFTPEFFVLRVPVITQCAPTTTSEITVASILNSGGFLIAQSSTLTLDTPANLLAMMTSLTPYTCTVNDSFSVRVHNDTGGVCTINPGAGFLGLTNLTIPNGSTRCFQFIWTGGNNFSIY